MYARRLDTVRLVKRIGVVLAARGRTGVTVVISTRLHASMKFICSTDRIEQLHSLYSRLKRCVEYGVLL